MRSYTAWTRCVRSAKATSRRPASARASGSRSRPTRVSRGCAASSAAAWPPSPSVVSTRTAGRSASAGPRSSTTRGRSTGTCLAPAGPPAAPASGCCPTAHLPPRACRSGAGTAARRSRRRDRGRRPTTPSDRAPSRRPRGYGGGPGTGEGVSGPSRVAHGIRDGARAERTPPPRTSVPRPALEKAGEYLLLSLGVVVLVFVLVALPGLGVPDLGSGERPQHHAVLGETGVAAQLRDDGDPALRVGVLLVRAGEQVALEGAGRLARERSRRHLPGHLREGLAGEHVQAVVLPLRDHQPASQLVPELRGQRQPPLVVQLGGVGAEEHDPTSTRGPPRAPAITTLPHFPPPSTATAGRGTGSRDRLSWS